MSSSSAAPFSHILSPGQIGPVELSNRIVLPAMDMNLCDNGEITDAEVAHYAARAAGGTGMIITGSSAVSFPKGAASHKQPGLSDDRFIPGLRRLADAVHDAGSKLCVQLCHHSKTARVDIAEDRPLLVASMPIHQQDMSALGDNTGDEFMALAATTGGKMPSFVEATEEDIWWAVDQFAQAAQRVKEAGADAVEIHAAHGYLLSVFLSAADNRRHDKWGGSIDNRARLTVEVIRAVRGAVGDDMAVTVRVSGAEFAHDDEQGALTIEESTAAARLFEAAGADAIHVTAMGRNSFVNFTDGPLPDQIGQYRSLAAAVKAAVSVPVISVGRVTPELAEEMVGAGECDFVSMGRQLLADPGIVNQLRSGDRASVRPCINCYVCVEQNFFDGAPRCAVNPALGNEVALSLVSGPAETLQHVVVIGAGPGGMESARLARAKGHRVTLLEAADRLGGTAWFSSLTTPANEALVDWLSHEVDRLGVDVQLNTRATAAIVANLKPDVVVVATGAVRSRPEVDGAELDHVMTGDELRNLMTGGDAGKQSLLTRAAVKVGGALNLTGDPATVRKLSKQWMPVGKRVTIVGGGLVGLELSEFLAERGRTVTVLEPGAQMGLPMAMPRRWTAVRRATDHGVTLERNAALDRITATHVHWRRNDHAESTQTDSVIIANGVSPGGALASELSSLPVLVHVVGDAAEVGYIEGAIHSAWDLAQAHF